MSIRYHFSNRSEDIIGLFTAALDALEIPWIRSTKYIAPKDRAVPLNGVHYAA